jgi:hypothetical protein
MFEPLNELLSNNSSNLVGKMLIAYIKLLAMKYHSTTPYHSRINSKVENLNGLIDSMLIKMLTNKPIIL